MQVPWEALVSVILYIIASTLGFVWWMATQTMTLQFVKQSLDEALMEIKKFDVTYAKSIEVAKDLGRMDLRMDAAWEAIEKLRDNKMDKQ